MKTLRHVITRECVNLGGCKEYGKPYSQVYEGRAQSHPHLWPVSTCFCGRDMRVVKVEDLRPDSELAKALDGLIGGGA